MKKPAKAKRKRSVRKWAYAMLWDSDIAEAWVYGTRREAAKHRLFHKTQFYRVGPIVAVDVPLPGKR